MPGLADIDTILATLDPSVRAVVGPIVAVLRVVIEGLQEQLARAEARNEQLIRTLYGRRSEQIPDPKREARKRANAKRTPAEREAARQASREKSRARKADLPVVEKVIPVPDEARVVRIRWVRDAMPLHRQAKALAREGCTINPTQPGAMFHRVADQSSSPGRAALQGHRRPHPRMQPRLR